jgi:cytochrome c peroxidase
MPPVLLLPRILVSRASRSLHSVCASLLLFSICAADSQSQTQPPANSSDGSDLTSPQGAPEWFMPAYRHSLKSPRPFLPQVTPPYIPQLALFDDPAGSIGNYQPGGGTVTAPNAFFQSLGTNGRTCFTCHQTPNAMGMSAAHARAVFDATDGRDPLFAPVDGANCPNQVPAPDTGATLGLIGGSATDIDRRAAHSLLLNKGLFRIFLPLPTRAEFSIEVVSDPNGCNTDPAYNQVVDPTTGAVTRIISVYRRPLMASSLKFKTITLADFPGSGIPPINLQTGTPLPVDPFTGLYESLNIMWDGREPTLESQATDAVLIHSQATTPPTSSQIAQIVAFENGIFSAQERLGPVPLWEGANGGATYLSNQSPNQTFSLSNPPPLNYFDSWSSIAPNTPANELKASIARGQALFENPQLFSFTIGNVSGFGCTSCHTQQGGGESDAPVEQRNIGVGGQSAHSNGPAPDPSLPIFKLACVPGAQIGNDGPVVYTNDPGLALITGQCAHIGEFTTAPMRGLAARAPYFHDGSAATIRDIVDFYDKRFSIGLTDQQKEDLVHFMKAL